MNVNTIREEKVGEKETAGVLFSKQQPQQTVELAKYQRAQAARRALENTVWHGQPAGYHLDPIDSRIDAEEMEAGLRLCNYASENDHRLNNEDGVL